MEKKDGQINNDVDIKGVTFEGEKHRCIVAKRQERVEGMLPFAFRVTDTRARQLSSSSSSF